MRRITCLTLPLLLLFFTGCADQTTAPDLDVTASFAKVIDCDAKPNHPKCGGDDPGGGGDGANPVITFAAGTPGNRTLWVADADGDHVTEVYTGSYMMHSSWSDQGEGAPDDPYVILVSRYGAPIQPLVKLELVVEGGVPIVLKPDTLSEEEYHYAVVRPKGNGQEFAAIDGNNHLVLGNMNTGDVVPLYPWGTPDEGWRWAPAWNADGTKLAFFERGPYPEYLDVSVVILDIPTEVTVPLEEATPEFSFPWVKFMPRGLSWARTTNELLLDVDNMIYRVNLDLPEPSLDNFIFIGNGVRPSWSPDDSQIVYDYRERIYVKTDGVRRDKKLPSGTLANWRR